MATHYVSPDGMTRIVNGSETPTVSFERAISDARPGDLIQILSGVYTVPFVVDGVSGAEGRAIVIQGDGGATLDGRRNLVRPPDFDEPSFEHFAFIKIRRSAHVEVSNLTIQNVWPTAVYIEDSRHLSFSHLNVHGSTFAFFARGRSTRDLLIERCAWVQDVQIWDGILWKDIHHMPRPRKELDGDFFRSFSIAGRIIIRRNLIAHAFNGIHLFADPKDRVGSVNNGVWIYENTLQFIRDNAIEAEYLATNWWVYRNRIYNCHKWFAFEHCRGGHWYVFANVGWFDRKPGPKDDEFNGGGVFKANKIKRRDMEGRRLPNRPVYVFHNSWYLRSSYVKKGKLRKFNHFNNAIEYARPGSYAPGIINPHRDMFGKDFTREWTRLEISFRNDLCNHLDFPDHYALVEDMQIEGIHAEPRFREPENGYFAPQTDEPKSPLIGAGKAVQMAFPGSKTWNVPAGLNIGAVSHVQDQADALYGLEDLNAPPEARPPILDD